VVKSKIKNFKKILCFDIDNTICKTIGRSYSDAKPIKKKINQINELYNSGYYIKLFTSRYMGRNNENLSKAKKQGLKMTKKQLKDWNLKYHKLLFGKPSYDLFIDDKSIFFKKDWHKHIKNYL
tara:strand:+ start:299 stop:667 length:369 start_codon:yes stop_codon:yes gene_type:complete